MSKVLTFSKSFPAYHPRKGQPTFFVEKIWLWMVNVDGYSYPEHFPEFKKIVKIEDILTQYPASGKGHTIRRGNRWKVGDKFSPRVWSGKPYQSKQVIIAPDIEVKKIFPFEIKIYHDGYWIDFAEQKVPIEYTADLSTLAQNDGLTVTDMLDWFINPKKKDNTMEGQIICWNESIKY